MPDRNKRLLLDSSVMVMWHIPAEPSFLQAREVLLDGKAAAVSFACSDQMPVEITSAFLKAVRRGRISRESARQALNEILGVPFTLYRATERILHRAFDIAEGPNQKLYDCVPVAMAERHKAELWTGDERLYNALGRTFPFVRWLAHYQPKRPSP